MLFRFLVFATVQVLGPPAALPQEVSAPPAGTRVKLAIGQLFVPAGYRPVNGKVHLVLHLHGSTQVAEQNLARSGRDAVLVTVVLKGLSSVYGQQFAHPETLRKILNETLDQLRQLGVADEPQLDRVTVSSFSAGFGGVREMLKSEDCYQRIDALIMADSIYAGFTGDPAERKVDPELMRGFLRFARDAAAGKKAMVVSHSGLVPETYASTAETADFLIEQLGIEREAMDKTWADGWRCVSIASKGRLHVYGFAGDTGADHMKHLQNLWRLMVVARGNEPLQNKE